MIEILNLHKQFGELTVIDSLSLSIPQGQTVSLIGPSGSGKSTVLRCINFLETPTSGSIHINGTLLTQTNAPALRKKIGMVFQNFHLFPHLNVLQNITYAPITVNKIPQAQANQIARDLLAKVGLSNKETAFPHQLSGGQKQRVAIARTLAMDPEIILFDEPTSALDPEMVKEVLTTIEALAHTGITILLVTHEMSFAKRVSDRILFLDHGKLLEDSPPQAFFNQPTSPRAQLFLTNML